MQMASRRAPVWHSAPARACGRPRPDGASALASKQLSPERARARHTADAIADSAGVARRGDLITGQMYHGGRWRRLNRLSNDDDD